MGADALAPSVARASVTTVLIMRDKRAIVLHEYEISVRYDKI